MLLSPTPKGHTRPITGQKFRATAIALGFHSLQPPNAVTLRVADRQQKPRLVYKFIFLPQARLARARAIQFCREILNDLLNSRAGTPHLTLVYHGSPSAGADTPRERRAAAIRSGTPDRADNRRRIPGSTGCIPCDAGWPSIARRAAPIPWRRPRRNGCPAFFMPSDAARCCGPLLLPTNSTQCRIKAGRSASFTRPTSDSTVAGSATLRRISSAIRTSSALPISTACRPGDVASRSIRAANEAAGHCRTTLPTPGWMQTTGRARKPAGSAAMAALAAGFLAPDLTAAGTCTGCCAQAAAVAATSCTSRSETCARLRTRRTSPLPFQRHVEPRVAILMVVAGEKARPGVAQHVAGFWMHAQVDRQVVAAARQLGLQRRQGGLAHLLATFARPDMEKNRTRKFRRSATPVAACRPVAPATPLHPAPAGRFLPPETVRAGHARRAAR